MSLKVYVEQVPEGLETFYKEVDGKFVLDVEDVDILEADKLKKEVPELKNKVKEFREHNIQLRTQIEQLSNDGVKQPNIQELVDSKVFELKSRVEQIEVERQTLKHQLEEVVLSDKAKDYAVKYGVHDTALPDVINRARHAFTVENGTLVPKDKEYRDDAGNPLTLEKWMTDLRDKHAPHCFKASTGTGSKRPTNGNIGSVAELSPTDKIKNGLNNIKGPKKSLM